MKECSDIMSLTQFRGLFPVSSCLSLGDDVCLIDVRYDSSLSVLAHPCRFDGFLAFFCVSGHIRVMINLVEFDVRENSLFIYMPGDIISIADVDETGRESLNFIVIAMTDEYIGSLDVNTSDLMEKRMMLTGRPFFHIRDDERMIAKKYVMLASDILGSNLAYKRESISSLLSSFLFLAGGIAEERMAAMKPARPGRFRSREVAENFLRLLAEWHSSERSVHFYAEKLGITPKYLSKLVRSATGKSAPEWIDDYVILEARNMLRHSDMPIKEIAGRLHFADQPTFHKFFKSHTGLTPMQYRRG